MALENYAAGSRGFPDRTVIGVGPAPKPKKSQNGKQPLHVLIAGYDATVTGEIKQYLHDREEEFVLYTDSETGGEGVKQALQGVHPDIDGHVRFDIAVVSPKVKWQSHSHKDDYDGIALKLILEDQEYRPEIISFNPEEGNERAYLDMAPAVRNKLYGHAGVAFNLPGEFTLYSALDVAIQGSLLVDKTKPDHNQISPMKSASRAGKLYQMPAQQNARNVALEVRL
jgi:hypothetical protein